MANFCISRLSCEKEILENIVKNYITNGDFYFNAIIPAEGNDDRSEKWGTKCYPNDVKRENENTIRFSNPWSPPEPIIHKLAELYEGHEFRFEYHDEVYEFSGEEHIKYEENTLKRKGCPAQSQSLDRQLETAKKTGYVQGVCECIAAIGDNHTLGKKRLSEMNVTKDMAKKYANPETYKTLEQGIFAPRHEQKLEQTHNIRR
jgi:hypothetical protein